MQIKLVVVVAVSGHIQVSTWERGTYFSERIKMQCLYVTETTPKFPCRKGVCPTEKFLLV